MDIALLNVRITLQKNETMVDEIGNHLNTWKDYYSCYATVSGEGGTETAVAGLTVDNSDLIFTARFCNLLKAVDTTGYRIVFNKEQYNIVALDHINFKKKSLKFKCQKVRR